MVNRPRPRLAGVENRKTRCIYKAPEGKEKGLVSEHFAVLPKNPLNPCSLNASLTQTTAQVGIGAVEVTQLELWRGLCPLSPQNAPMWGAIEGPWAPDGVAPLTVHIWVSNTHLSTSVSRINSVLFTLHLREQKLYCFILLTQCINMTKLKEFPQSVQ